MVDNTLYCPSIGMHLFNHHVKALLLANIVYLYILNFKGIYVILVISINEMIGTSIPCIFLYFHTKM